MTETYTTERDWNREAILAVDEMAQKGHDINANGVCSSTCKACEPYLTLPGKQYQRILELARKKINGPPRLNRVVAYFAIHRTELHALAQDPHVSLIHKTTNLGILVCVTLQFVFDDQRKATVCVRGLGPIQGRKEAYTPETLPAPMPWTERSSEGVNPFHKNIKEK